MDFDFRDHFLPQVNDVIAVIRDRAQAPPVLGCKYFSLPSPYAPNINSTHIVLEYLLKLLIYKCSSVNSFICLIGKMPIKSKIITATQDISDTSASRYFHRTGIIAVVSSDCCKIPLRNTLNAKIGRKPLL